jgi:ABC-2 type transport system permease protein
MNSIAAETAPTPAPAARASTLNTLVMLTRRELWEHRGLWLGPLVTAGLLVLCAFSMFRGEMNIAFEGANLDWLDAPHKDAAMAWAYMGISAPLYLVLLCIASFYLLDCLYAERKDRSILFWKSLPVSDGLTVASKFLVAAVLAPLFVFVLSAVTGLVITGIYDLRVALGHAPGLVVWDGLAWLEIQLAFLVSLIAVVLWYAPLAAALLLVSAWVRRNPFVWSTAVPLLAALFERIAFGTHYLWHFIVYRCNGIFMMLGYREAQAISGRQHHEHLPLIGAPDFGTVFSSLDLWLGVIAAVVLLYAAVRVRRYRDEG